MDFRKYQFTRINKHKEVTNFFRSSSHVNPLGKVFIKCLDKINNSNYNIVPYSIQVLIDGIEKANFVFDYLNKDESYFTINKNIKFEKIYLNKEPFDFYIMDYYGLPGLIGFKVIIEDFNGNKSVFIRNLKILPPKSEEVDNN